MKFTYLLVISMVIWGVSWSVAKQISHMAELEVVIFWRNLVTFLSLIPAILYFRLKPPIHRMAFLQATVGAILMTVYNYLFFLGLRSGLPGAGGVLVTTLNPLLNFALVSIFYGHNWNRKEFIGLVLGLTGGLVILRVWDLHWEQIAKGGNLAFLLASFIWALLSIQTQRSKVYIDPISYSFYVYGISSVFTLLVSLQYDWLAPLSFGYKFWGNIFYLSAISTAFATTIYFIASSKLGSHIASSFIFIVPASAAFSSWIIVGEKPLITTIIGGGMALIAARIIQPAKKKELPEPEIGN